MHTEHAPKKKRRHTKWWVSTVMLTFFPTIAVGIMSVLRNTPVEIVDLIGDGELVLSSLIIVTSTLFDCYNNGSKIFPDKAEKIYFSLIVIDTLEVLVYTTIRTNPSNKPLMVYIASGLCTVTSIYVSRLWNQLEKGVK